MSNYDKLRVSYVNKWPDVQEFDAEKYFRNRCNRFISENGSTPFLPMKAWDYSDAIYQIYISRLIDALEMMPYWPNRAFAFLFGGFDYFGEERTKEKNITKRLKKLSNDIFSLSKADGNVDSLLSTLFESIPMSAAAYLFKRQLEESNVYKRITEDESNHPTSLQIFMSNVNKKFAMIQNPVVLRKAAAFIRIVFSKTSVFVDSNTYHITHNERLNLLISGMLYTLRNDSLHGSSISVTKSSQTTVERYALNYYAFLSLYTIASLLVIKEDDPGLAATRYYELNDRMQQNFRNMKLLFGNHLSK